MFTGVARSADLPFTDGPGSARSIQKALAAEPTMTRVSCRYRSPVVVCSYFSQLKRSPSKYVRTNLTIHKTHAKGGYAIECWPLLGICDRQPMRFAR